MSTTNSKRNMTKKDLVIGLTLAVEHITDAPLKESVQYALKKLGESPKSVTIGELRSLYKEAKKFIPDEAEQLTIEPKDPAPAPAPSPAPKEKAEASLKKKGTKKSKPEPAPSPAPKKTEEKKKPAKESPIKKEKKKQKPSLQMIEQVAAFPNTIQVGDVTLQIENVTTSEELDKLLSSDNKYVYAAFVWTPRHLRQFSYGDPQLGIIPPKKGKFENDLDVVEIAYHAEMENYSIFGGYSVETGCPYAFNGATLKPDDDGIRYSLGIEYAIYSTSDNDEE